MKSELQVPISHLIECRLHESEIKTFRDEFGDPIKVNKENLIRMAELDLPFDYITTYILNGEFNGVYAEFIKPVWDKYHEECKPIKNAYQKKLIEAVWDGICKAMEGA